MNESKCWVGGWIDGKNGWILQIPSKWVNETRSKQFNNGGVHEAVI